jgi:hypothetical protein
MFAALKNNCQFLPYLCPQTLTNNNPTPSSSPRIPSHYPMPNAAGRLQPRGVSSNVAVAIIAVIISLVILGGIASLVYLYSVSVGRPYMVDAADDTGNPAPPATLEQQSEGGTSEKLELM